jgi:hypothetical protein
MFMGWLKTLLCCDDCVDNAIDDSLSAKRVMKSTINKGYLLFKGDELERYSIAIRRIEEKYGVNNCGLTQFAWAVLSTRDYRIDPESDEIPG